MAKLIRENQQEVHIRYINLKKWVSHIGVGVLSRLSTGIAGLDDVLFGGFIPGQAYLLRGGPGAGKTTLGLHFLVSGATQGERSLYITLGEQEAQIRRNAELLGFDLTNVTFLDLSPNPEFFTQLETYDIFTPGEVEREPVTNRIIEVITRLQPSRVFLDAITQFRYLAPDQFQFHKQALSFLRYLTDSGATAIFTSECSAAAPDDDLQFLSDGVLHLEGAAEQRTMRVSKFRGSDFRSGTHSVKLTDRGMEVFPRLHPETHGKEFSFETIPSGIPELDELLCGGIERGTTTILTGPSGVGKSTVGMQFMKEAAGRGERSVVYLFDEAPDTLMHRCENINIPVRVMAQRGTLSVASVEPLRYSPDEFARMVRQEVEERKATIVMIDSVASYRLSLRGQDLVTHLHALCKYLKNMGVTVILANEVDSVTGDFRVTENGISYLADNVVFLRYLEIDGKLKKAIGVLKKRLSDYEKTLRELEITRYGIKIGRPLTGLRGILRGTPEWVHPDRE